MIVNKTKEEAGKGYQILAAIMPKTYSSKNNKVTFWEALTNNRSGFEKWINVIMNGLSIIVFFIIIFSMVYFPISSLYKFIIWLI